ncbi:hypothetical protein BOTCAL_0025g00160 [Botryotinia calthae]|uniref:F-box domain-containing protein n=1 Tax=Botryotinia calthae TaxID=38488 RepID=A0A4Y8DGS0_9HELO|nr:hypothetical protein BOTCAL_0025g00160 [Botryotinia calthae]
MPAECELLVRIWCSPAPTEPLANALHTECLSYLESVKLPMSRTLQSLPAEIQSQIIENLGFVGRAKLRETNYFYNATIPAVTPNNEELLVYACDMYPNSEILRQEEKEFAMDPSAIFVSACSVQYGRDGIGLVNLFK